ncbi:hypothetical protein [Halorientalis pallida]|uniref:DUF8135 domain-containing protein n=1 Tax=Halorientalis pallida TaxID=2479928 RepID=A0A498L0F1_9EURY|nr:hypothetical protein [Halorientalis pallida]RXK51758.1 hypothetical protein EAF64_03750 [Halorientalis pallida]
MTEDEDDPFDAFEAPDDEDDPFEELAPPDADDAADTAGDHAPDETLDDDPTPPGRLRDDPFDTADSADADAHAGGEVGSPTPDEADGDTVQEPTDDPFASFSTTRRDEGDDPFDAFESAGVDEIDPDAVWEDLESGGAEAEERTYSEVSKHRFCEGCEHFSPPPEIECTHESAAIVEFLDTETVRLLNCPVVAEQRALEGSGVDLGDDSE